MTHILCPAHTVKTNNEEYTLHLSVFKHPLDGASSNTASSHFTVVHRSLQKRPVAGKVRPRSGDKETRRKRDKHTLAQNSPVIVGEVRVQRVPVKQTGPSGDERHGAVVVHVAQFATVPRLLLTSLVRRCRRRRLMLVSSARCRRLPPRMRTQHAAARHGSANGRPPRAFRRY